MTSLYLLLFLFFRVKEIDWIPYLTQRLVDDVASHLRLFKQSRAKMKLQEITKESNKKSPSRDFKSPRKSIHKRNKSEADVNWYSGKMPDIRKGKP